MSLLGCKGFAVGLDDVFDGVNVPKACGADDGRLDGFSLVDRLDGSADGSLLGVNEIRVEGLDEGSLVDWEIGEVDGSDEGFVEFAVTSRIIVEGVEVKDCSLEGAPVYPSGLLGFVEVTIDVFWEGWVDGSNDEFNDGCDDDLNDGCDEEINDGGDDDLNDGCNDGCDVASTLIGEEITFVSKSRVTKPRLAW